MNSSELYDDVVLKFPDLSLPSPAWVWVNVHDGKEPRIDIISNLLERHIGSQEVVVIVHSEPGTVAVLPKGRAAAYVAGHVLRHEVQVSDPLFTHFVSVSRSGVATNDA